MLFASAEPTATKKPRTVKVAGSEAPKITAALEANRRVEGPAKGIKPNPNEENKTNMSSMNVAMQVQP